MYDAEIKIFLKILEFKVQHVAKTDSIFQIKSNKKSQVQTIPITWNYTRLLNQTQSQLQNRIQTNKNYYKNKRSVFWI